MHEIGEAARLSGVKVETIRYYERDGVVPPPDRSASGRRLYDSAAVARLRFVKRSRDLGFSIADIKTLMALAPASGRACGDVKEIGERHLRDVRVKIADLLELEDALVALIHDCDSGRSDCPALRKLFAA